LTSDRKRVVRIGGYTVDLDKAEKIAAEYRRRLGQARELRREKADWDYIESREEPLKTALKLFVETGDLWFSAKLTGVPIDVLNEERRKAKIPIVVV